MSSRPKRSISSRGLPRSKTRPACSRITSSHSRSTSAMLCEASRIVACGLALVVLEVAAHPVGGVGIERGRRLVEQQHVGLVDQRLGQRHARLLAGRQLAGRAVEERRDLHVLGDLLDAAGAGPSRRRAGRRRRGSGARSGDAAGRHRARRSSCAAAPRSGAAACRCPAPRSRPPSARAGRAAWRWSWSCRRRCRPAARARRRAAPRRSDRRRRRSRRTPCAGAGPRGRGVRACRITTP